MSDLSSSIHDLVDGVLRANGFEEPTPAVSQADGYSEPPNLRCAPCGNFRRAVPAHKPDCPKAWKNCPGCAGTDPAGLHLASCPLSGESVLRAINRAEMYRALTDLLDARTAVLRCHTALPDWNGPAGAKLTSVRRYLESQSHPLEAALLADPLEVR